jgi:hypothetical protein
MTSSRTRSSTLHRKRQGATSGHQEPARPKEDIIQEAPMMEYIASQRLMPTAVTTTRVHCPKPRRQTPSFAPVGFIDTLTTPPWRRRHRDATVAWPGKPDLGFPLVHKKEVDHAKTMPPIRIRRPQALSLSVSTAVEMGFLPGQVQPPSKTIRAAQTRGWEASHHPGPQLWEEEPHPAADDEKEH